MIKSKQAARREKINYTQENNDKIYNQLSIRSNESRKAMK